MSGFSGRTHSEASKARIAAAMLEQGRHPPSQKGKPLTEPHREKLRGAKLGVPKTAEHRARIAEGLRRYWDARPEAWQRRRGIRRFLSDEEAADLNLLRARLGYSEEEALRAIGRPDLIGASGDGPPLTHRD